ncbi:MAG: HD domain-containing protein [Pelosinus sp.]|nr:HD domain-containing protein [Pelosinus sp.]
MDSEAVEKFKKWFDTYVKTFYSKDEDMQLHVEVKERHTYHVCDNIRSIGQSLKLGEAELKLAETVALFHDVGRFRQYQTYRTFNDKRSVNHAELSAKVLEELGVLKGLTDKEQQLIKKAVLYHNRRSIPDNEAAEVLLYAKLIRDADKLDIFAMIVGEDENCKMVKSPELEESTRYSAKIAADILEDRLAFYEDIQTSADQMLFRASWVYGLYFPYSSRYMLEKQYVQKMLCDLPQDALVQQVTLHLEEYLAIAGDKVSGYSA